MATMTTPRAMTNTLDNRIIARMRLILAVSALIILAIDPSEPDQLVAVTYITLGLYVGYCLLVYLAAIRSSPIMASIVRWAHWIDLAWYLLLISFSRGTSSIFFFFFFFAILVGSFRWGFATGLRVTLVSAFLFTTIGYLTAPRGSEFELNRFLLRPIYLIVLGYMMAYWGGFEITFKRRLALLKEVAQVSNPRFGVDRTIGGFMEQLRAFYSADGCTLVAVNPASDGYTLRRTSADRPESAMRAEPVPAEVARQLLSLPADLAVVYNSPRRRWWPFGLRFHAYDVVSGERSEEGEPEFAALAETLDAPCFVTVPVRLRNETRGRLFLTARRPFDQGDPAFILQVIEHVAPVIENIRLVDRLTSDAADEARQRIARDLHDSVIQPYIGLQIGLAACRQKVAAGNDNVEGDLERLLALTNEGIAELRGYVRGLKSGGAREASLIAAVRRFAARFGEATSIDVRVDAADNLQVNDRLAAEVFQLVAEGLSNIRRHTTSCKAAVELSTTDHRLCVRVENDLANGHPSPPFTPRSISERAAALGGRARVEQKRDATTVVVEIPL